MEFYILLWLKQCPCFLHTNPSSICSRRQPTLIFSFYTQEIFSIVLPFAVFDLQDTFSDYHRDRNFFLKIIDMHNSE